MKFNIKKSILSAAVVTMAVGGVTTSCTGDLDVNPINPQQTLVLDEDALFNKLYASFSLTGQTGGAGNGDIPAEIFNNEGMSGFYRMAWSLNEFTTDEAGWVWSDAGVPELLHNQFAASNTFSFAMYYRLYFTITLCNSYINQVGDAQKVAEARLIRALNYMYVMDLYGAGPMSTAISADLAPYYTRKELFEFCETELKDIINDLADEGTNTYGRVDKAAAYLLLARLYLNAEVYTGTARWDDAMTYAEKVIKSPYYHLNKESKNGYSAYQMLFLADNNQNGAQYEAVFPVLLDGQETRSYDAMNFLVFSNYGASENEAVPSGTNISWGKCARVKGKLVEKFFGSTPAPDTDNLAEMVAAAGDDRALFFSKGYSQYVTTEAADEGFSCVKFRNVRSDGQSAKSIEFVDTDLPLLRVAEAYLTYAEASIRKNGLNSTANGYINELRARANATQESSYTLDDVFDEWAREFWFEGRRRIDLVRFGRFGGQSEYLWEFMNNIPTGGSFSSNFNVFGIPSTDLETNTNLKQNAGY
ncbi:MAG: RagB/SusD family nutrient uptake outer membrane protein [Bacteroidaceae bacterium]|nr:RagB/SusD family nutrient uptake outer membrane protein [Bacteroidaceae bacterium]